MGRMMKRCMLALFLGLGSLMSVWATGQDLKDGWEFYRGDLGSPWEALRTGRPAELPVWEQVSLPHSCNAFDGVDPDVAYYQGPAWYRILLDIRNPHPGGRSILRFGGAGQRTRVYVYDRLVGEHVGGYDAFSMDISEAVEAFREGGAGGDFKGLVPVLVRTDNSRDVEMIPSDLSDFNIYNGLYRGVSLDYVPAISVERLLLDPRAGEKGKNWSLRADISLYNPADLQEELELELRILAPGGEELQTENIIVAAGETAAGLELKIRKPERWSPDHPALYTAELSYASGAGEGTLSERFGFRTFEFIQQGPFMLNGERLLLRGTHRHEDHAGVGPAMTDAMIRKEMRMMKDMGVNFIRLGHYQQSKVVLEACDELGILVWEEIPWCRGGLGGERYRSQARRMLENMIVQHRNHPSVIIWGLGNENDWPGDFDHFGEDSIRAFMQELNELSHALDPARKTAIRRCDFCKDIVDVYSPSIWAGWYRGKYTDYMEVSRTHMEEVDHFLHVEWGASNHARRHSENPDLGLEQITSSDRADERDGDFLMSGGEARVSRDGDWTESYAVNLIDWHLKEQEKMDWLTGTAYWPFKDFSTPLRPENPVPYVNQKGVVERDLTKKESYYVFQSYWTGKPMIRIYGHSWPVRWATGSGGNMVKVYSNCPEAELFLNGKSQGKRQRESRNFPAAGLRWVVDFRPGKNELYVRGEKDGTVVEDRIELEYETRKWGKPASFSLEEIKRSGDTLTLRAILYDVKGIPCLDATSRVRFGLSGDGRLLDNLGTSTGSRVVQLCNGRAEISLLMQGGSSVASIASEGLSTAFCSIDPIPPSEDPEVELDRALDRIGVSLELLDHSGLNPRCMEPGGEEIRMVPSRDWTSGFFPGMLWLLYEYNGGVSWLEAARHYSANVEDQQFNAGTHDMGFKIYCSFGQGYRLTGDARYREVLLQSAETLATRFNKKVGCIRSWDHHADEWDYPVIIDNMMNLELLFRAAREGGDQRYYDMAVTHAETTMKNHFREDMSTWHVVSYDSLTGRAVKKETHQGIGHESEWARGQAWGLYGYTMCYRETGRPDFLAQAGAIADYLLEHPNLPEDGVPYWDFDDPLIPHAYRDVSAAAIMASALIELADYLPARAMDYRGMADRILDALARDYTLEDERGLPFLLDHSVGRLPQDDEIDVPIIYADYYYLEALMRKRRSMEKRNLTDLEEGEYGRVIGAAERYLEKAPQTITAFPCERSQGGIHDFYSEGDYWWPDPEHPGGPYIRRDGESNPDNFTAHREAMWALSMEVPALTAAFLLTGEEKYADHALLHLRAWFLDEASRMNPSLLYAQAIKGRVSGRGIGIIDTIHLIEVARAIEVLIGAGYLQEADAGGLRKWFGDYNTWITTHPYGLAERDHGNNHSAWWTAQVAAFAALTGDEEKQDFCREHFKNKILSQQVDSLGRFADEIKRSKPYSYSMFNMEAFALISHMLSDDKQDLWDYRSPDGKSTRLALEWLHPYWKEKSTWPFPPDIEHWKDLPVRGSALLFAGMHYQEPEYIQTWTSLPADSEVEEVIRTFVIRQPLLWFDFVN